jgi:iron-sulfur cluster repair protein YtfE (RIC family)
MKATKLLQKQHAKVKSLFARLDASEGDPAELVAELAGELAAHMAIEQQIFYPTVRALRAELVDLSYEEHSLAELALKRLLRTSPGDPQFHPRAMVLREVVEHHMGEEERELFPAVERGVGDEELEQLGERLEAQFVEARKQGFEALWPSGFTRTSADEFERLVQKDEGLEVTSSASPRSPTAAERTQ